VAEQRAIIEYQILQLAALNCHQHDARRIIDRRDHAFAARFERDAVRGTYSRANAAAETNRRVEFRFVLGRVVRIVRRNNRHRFHRANVRALATTVARVELNLRQEIRRVDGMQQAEFARGDQRFAATAATVADEIDARAHILAELHQVVRVRLREQIHPFRLGHCARDTVPDQRLGATVERHTNFFRRGAILADVLHLVAAVADANAYRRGAGDDVTRAFVIEDVKRVVGGKHRLVDEDASQLRFADRKQRADEIVFDGDVLIVQLGKRFLVEVAAIPHQREFEKARHRRRQDVQRFAIGGFRIQENRAAGKSIEHVARGGIVHFPNRCRLADGEWLERDLRDEFGFARAEEHLQNAKEQFRRRRALGKTIEAFR